MWNIIYTDVEEAQMLRTYSMDYRKRYEIRLQTNIIKCYGHNIKTKK